MIVWKHAAVVVFIPRLVHLNMHYPYVFVGKITTDIVGKSHD